MIAMNEAAMTSCYMDAAAILVMLLMMVTAKRVARRKNPSLHVFQMFSLFLTITCMLSFICHAMIKQTAPWCHTMAIAGKTLLEWFSFLCIFLWAFYVEITLYGIRKQRFPVKVLYNIPFLVFTVLLLFNLFTGTLFICTEENQFEYGRLHSVFLLIEALYLAISVIKVQSYHRKEAKICFVRVLPMLVPLACGVSVQFFLPCQADFLGFAIGALLTYTYMAEMLDCLDEESGLYNKRFLTYLFDRAMAGRNDTRSVLILEMNGNLPAGFDILRETLHQDGDVIRAEEKRFLMFSGEGNRSTLQYLSSLVDEAVSGHNARNPGEQVQITVRCRMRTGAEDAFEFLRSVMDEKETGDEMRGVMSMISELDRLDEELRLASDIQLNMLPMKFPAFPDRTEFDLYASMTPAKEVGGDFYDFFLIDDDHLALVIADVSGKGIPASLFMMVSKTLIKNQLMTGCDPAAALDRVNQQLCERNSSMMFVTVWLAVLEISTGRGLACNAGHENPGFKSTGAGFELRKYEHDMFLGARKKARYRNRPFELRAGDCIFVYTDGVTDATRADMEMFGEERLTAELNEDADAAPESLIRRVHDAVNLFTAGASQFDDITMLCCKYYGPGNSGNTNTFKQSQVTERNENG